jgi:hypothetical protein
LPTLPDTLDSPPPVKPSRAVPKPLSNPAGSTASNGRVVASGGGRAAAAGVGLAADTVGAKAVAKSPALRELEAYIRSLTLHEQRQASQLLHFLAVNLLHRAVAAAGGDVSKAVNVSIRAAEAGELCSIGHT